MEALAIGNQIIVLRQGSIAGTCRADFEHKPG